MDEILIKYKADMSELNADYEKMVRDWDKTQKEIESKPLKLSGVDDLKSSLKLINQEAQKLGFGNLEGEIDTIVTDVSKLKKLIETLTASMKGMKQGSTEFKALESIIQGANRQLQSLTGNTEKAGASIRTQMRQSVAEVQNLADKYGLLDKRTIDAAKKAALLRDTVGDAQGLIQAFNPDTKFQGLTNALTGAVGGFTAVQGAMALIGNESEDLQKTLVKVNGAIALSSGIAQLQQSKDAFIALQAQAVASFQAIRAAIGLTGIGAFVLLIGGAVAAIEKYGTTAKEEFDKQDNSLKDINKLHDSRQTKLDYELAVMKSQGATEREILKYKESQLKLDLKQEESALKKLETKVNEAVLENQKFQKFKNAGFSFTGSLFYIDDDELAKIQARLRQAQDSYIKNKTEIINTSNEIREIDKKAADDRAKKENNGKEAAKKRLKDIADANAKLFEEQSKLRLNPYETREEFEARMKQAQKDRDVTVSLQAEKIKAKIEEKRIDEEINDDIEKNHEDVRKRIHDKDMKRLKDQEGALKSQILELSTFAQNGILLQIGLDPASVERVKASLMNAIDVFNNKETNPGQRLAAGAQLAGDAYFTVSNAIRESERRETERKMEELTAQQEEEIRLAGDNEQKKDIIRQKYELKKKELKRKEAEADKRKAIFDATVATAAQVAKVIATPWMIPIVAALGAVQIAMIAAQPIPKFEKGGRVKDGLLKGRPHAAGGIPLIAEGNEFIVNKIATARDLPLIEAVNNHKTQEYLNKHIVIPALMQYEAERRVQERDRRLEMEANIINKTMAKTLSEFKKESSINANRMINAMQKSKINI